jgi:general stress protein CsbA
MTWFCEQMLVAANVGKISVKFTTITLSKFVSMQKILIMISARHQENNNTSYARSFGVRLDTHVYSGYTIT